MPAETQPQTEWLTVRLPADLVRMARTVAANCDTTIGEIIESASRATVERRHKATVERLTRDLSGREG